MRFPKLERAQRRAALLIGGAIATALAIMGIGLHWLDDTRTSAPPAPASSAPLRDLTVLDDARAQRLRTLRDEALDCMGWAAGNSFRKAIWPEVESFVGHRGIYYDFMIELVPPGLPDELAEAERAANFERYRAAFGRGRQAPFDEAGARRCIARAIDVSAELEQVLDAAREPRTLGSPVSID